MISSGYDLGFRTITFHGILEKHSIIKDGKYNDLNINTYLQDQFYEKIYVTTENIELIPITLTIQLLEVTGTLIKQWGEVTDYLK